MHTALFIIAVVLLLWTASLYLRVPAPFGFALLFPRSLAGALSPVLSLVGVVGAGVSCVLGGGAAAVAFALAALLALVGAWRISRPQVDFAALFGPDWERRIPDEQRARMLRRRWSMRLPEAPAAVWERDVCFGTVPGSERRLLCDIWQPAEGVERSGLAYIYLHGSAWYVLDKDAYTRRFFRHLAAQGHVVMDVAYRLYPETDVPGMLADVKRALAWLKANAATYGVSPERIVVGGSSAGGHLAQLLGFEPEHPALTPDDLLGQDLTVRGIISVYGPSDLAACYRHTNQHKIPGVGVTPPDMAVLNAPCPAWMTRLLGPDAARMQYHKLAVAGRLDWVMGGTPEQVPGSYELCSPVTHVHAGCPPTLLIQGADDLITPVAATQVLCQKLQAVGVPAASLVLPHTDHMFDLMLLERSPSAQAALFAMERFLAVLAE